MSSDKAKVVEAEWGTRGFTCELWVDRPGKEWKDFVHNVDELLMAVEGEIELDMNGKTLRPQLGEEILIPAARLSFHCLPGLPPLVLPLPSYSF